MSDQKKQPKQPRETVAYVLRKFPVLSETFILNEILGLEARGIPVHIISLERPNDPRFHEDLPRLKASISYVPEVTDMAALMKFHERVARRYGADFQKALSYTLKHHRPGLYSRFLQSCYVADLVRRYKIGHFHSHFATRSTSVAFFAGMMTGLPYSFSAHAMDIFKTHLSSTALTRKIEFARFVVTISQYNMKLLEEVAPDSADKLVCIYNGIDLERFAPNGARPPRDPFTFLCVARLVEKKGHTILLDACHKLKEKGVPFQCLVIGKGRLRSPLQEKIKKLDLGEHVHLLGPLRSGEVLERYRTSHACVLPCIEGTDGNKDGLPVSIVEAMACGLPVVTTPMTGIPEVVEHEKNGLLVPFHDARQLASEMERLVMDDKLCENLGNEARPSVEGMFDMHKTITQLEDLFRESLA